MEASTHRSKTPMYPQVAFRVAPHPRLPAARGMRRELFWKALQEHRVLLAHSRTEARFRMLSKALLVVEKQQQLTSLPYVANVVGFTVLLQQMMET
jgi:hypothetical protein